MIEITVKYGQTLLDVAIERYGCEEGVITLIEDNNLSLASVIVPGQKLLIRDVVPVLSENNQAVAALLSNNKIGIASGVVQEETPVSSGFYDDTFYTTDFYE